MIAFSGVRSSWLMLARKSLFARVAASAFFCATRSSSTSAASCCAFFRCVSCASCEMPRMPRELGLGALALDADRDRVRHRRHGFERGRREVAPREDRHDADQLRVDRAADTRQTPRCPSRAAQSGSSSGGSTCRALVTWGRRVAAIAPTVELPIAHAALRAIDAARRCRHSRAARASGRSR